MRPPAGLRVSREKRRYDVCFVSCDVWFNSMFPWITLQFSWTSYFLTSGLVGILSKVRSISSPPPFIPQSIGDYMGTFIIVVSLGYLLCRMAKSSMCNAVVNDSYSRMQGVIERFVHDVKICATTYTESLCLLAFAYLRFENIGLVCSTLHQSCKWRVVHSFRIVCSAWRGDETYSGS